MSSSSDENNDQVDHNLNMSGSSTSSNEPSEEHKDEVPELEQSYPTQSMKDSKVYFLILLKVKYQI